MNRANASFRMNRRRFLGVTAASGLWIASRSVGGAALRGRRVGPNDRITVGAIGVGKQGRYLAERMARRDDAQVVAVSDVVKERRDHAAKRIEEIVAKRDDRPNFQGCDAYADFRALLERDDLDAVIIGTPDHWHAIPCIMAARRGMHIYCEKPLTHNIAEGRRIVEAVHDHGVTFQTGSQQRSGEFGGTFRKAVNLIRNGRIGEIRTIRIGVGPPPVACDLPEEEVPDGTDWDFWVGPAPFHPYNEILCPKGVHDHFPDWRDYREYGGGGLADMGAHHFDIAQWALGMDGSGPVEIEPPEDHAAKSGLRFVYANGVEMFHGGPDDCTFEGTEGTIRVSRGKFACEPEEIDAPLPDDAERIEESDDHFTNFLGAIKSGGKPICHAEVGHRSASVCHLANIGYRLRRPLRWDPKAERFPDDDEANTLSSEAPRSGWDLL